MVENEQEADAPEADDTAKAGTEEKAQTTPEGEARAGKGLDAIFGVKLEVRVVLGRNRMPISELLDLTKGSVVELDRRVGETVDLMINDRIVARGDLVRVKGDMLGVALREIVKDFVTDI